MILIAETIKKFHITLSSCLHNELKTIKATFFIKLDDLDFWFVIILMSGLKQQFELPVVVC